MMDSLRLFLFVLKTVKNSTVKDIMKHKSLHNRRCMTVNGAFLVRGKGYNSSGVQYSPAHQPSAMRDSTLSILLLFILGFMSTSLYWSYYFFGPGSRPCQSEDPLTLGKRINTFKTHTVQLPSVISADADDDEEPAKEEGTGSKEKHNSEVKGLVFPPDRIPIAIEENQSTWDEAVKNFDKLRPKMDFNRLHFVHVPKAGGTSMNILLRQLMCEKDSIANKDCCVPGVCYKKRRCDVMVGCYGHIPNRYDYR